MYDLRSIELHYLVCFEILHSFLFCASTKTSQNSKSSQVFQPKYGKHQTQATFSSLTLSATNTDTIPIHVHSIITIQYWPWQRDFILSRTLQSTSTHRHEFCISMSWLCPRAYSHPLLKFPNQHNKSIHTHTHTHEHTHQVARSISLQTYPISVMSFGFMLHEHLTTHSKHWERVGNGRSNQAGRQYSHQAILRWKIASEKFAGKVPFDK